LGDPEGWIGAEESASARASRPVLELVSPSRATERQRRSRRFAVGLGAAAAVLMLGAAGAELWGAHRELRAIRDQRAAIAEDVGPLLLARDSLTELMARTQAMEDLAAARPQWTRALVELSELFPRDTYLTALYASGDTVELEAAGSRAGEAIQALREAELFDEVRLQGIVDRELENGETLVERFRLWARLARVPEGADHES
jgi:Tfp pilus assembly protein PilN